jgi:hypothetical protein
VSPIIRAEGRNAKPSIAQNAAAIKRMRACHFWGKIEKIAFEPPRRQARQEKAKLSDCLLCAHSDRDSLFAPNHMVCTQADARRSVLRKRS